ncbi:MAG: hypothetical protein AAF902_22870 [Chloroflexota bacterium]
MTNWAHILTHQIVGGFSQEPEITAIHSFGSVNTSSFDQYSDLDLTLVSSDLRRTSKNIKTHLNKILEVSCCFVLYEHDDEAAYSFFFDGLTVFQKLDLGIVSSNQPELFQGSKCLYTAAEPQLCKNSHIIKFNQPQREHEVLDVFIGASRFIKYTRRNQPWGAYKFFNSFRELFLKKAFRLPQKETLGLEAFKKIDAEGKQFLDLIYASSQKDISQVYKKYLIVYRRRFIGAVSPSAERLMSQILELFGKKP